MRLHLLSDTHLDAHGASQQHQEFLDKLDPEGADLLVLAGDALSRHSGSKMLGLFSRLLELYPQIIFVPGNHDYWGVSPEQAHESFRAAACGDARIHLACEPTVFEVGGQTFLCGTMWYPQPSKRKEQRFIDFDQTLAPKSWFFNQHKAFVDLLEDKGDSNTIVVTHHLPSPNSTPARFCGSSSGHFFMTDLTDEIMKIQPKLFLHGHTHDPCDYMIEKTRVVCNPRGYPPEYRDRAPYKPLLIEV